MLLTQLRILGLRHALKLYYKYEAFLFFLFPAKIGLIFAVDRRGHVRTNKLFYTASHFLGTGRRAPFQVRIAGWREWWGIVRGFPQGEQ